MTRIVASFALFAVALRGQSAAPAKPGKVEGVVISSVTNDPVKKAAVTLQALGGRGNYSAVTDAAGHFHFDSVNPGKYLPMATCDGFIPPRHNRFNPMTALISVAAEQEVKDVVVKLLPLAVVNGHVLDEDGDPLVWSQVQALRYIYREGGVRQLLPAGFATTDDLGEFQFLDLEPDRYYFVAVAHPHMERLPRNTKSAAPEQAYPRTFYPSASEAEQATATVVAAGAQVNGIDFHLRKAPAFHIRGKALDGRSGEPVRNRNFQVRTSLNIFFENGRVRPDGSFDVPGMVSGSYTLILYGQDHELSVRQNIEVGDHDVNDLVLVLRPKLEVTGTMRLEGKPPASGHRGQMRLTLVSMEQGMSAWTALNSDGSFALKVTPAEYQINAFCDAGAYVKSVHSGDQELAGGKIDLTQPSSGALNIVCGTDVGEIQGTVQTENGEPAAQAMITIGPDDEHFSRLDFHNVLISDQKGHFDYRDFAPGSYRVFAWESSDVDPQMLQSAEFRKAFESRAASVTVLPGGSASVQLNLIPASEIEAEKNKLQ